MKSIDFIKNVKSILQEQGKSPINLFDDKIISENTFYKYRERYPSLKTLVKLCNYLEISIDYLFERTLENNFKFYKVDNNIFYSNLTKLIDSKSISGRKFCKDLGFSRDNIIRWKNGINPSVQTLIEIANYFNCFIDDLIIQ